MLSRKREESNNGGSVTGHQKLYRTKNLKVLD